MDQALLEIWKSADLVELGMRADGERQRRHPGGIVTYCLEPGVSANRTVFDLEQHPDSFDAVTDAISIAPVCPPGKTAVDYLRLLAACRLHSNVEHIQVDVEWTGLKLAQVALRFGADDLTSNRKPGSQVTEEEIRRIIRDAGFVPKKRDPEFRSLSIF